MQRRLTWLLPRLAATTFAAVLLAAGTTGCLRGGAGSSVAAHPGQVSSPAPHDSPLATTDSSVTWSSYDSSRARRVPLHLPAGAFITKACWSPAGKAFACSVMNRDNADAGGRLAVVDATGRFRFLTEGYDDSDPAWSPDGKWIAFLRAPKATGQGPQDLKLKTLPRTSLCLVAAAGGPVRDLAGGGDLLILPASWSPDGHALAAVAAASKPPIGEPHGSGTTPTGFRSMIVVTVGNDGQKAGEVSIPLPTGRVLGAPSWSPDGARLAAEGGQYAPSLFKTGLYVLDVRGKKVDMVDSEDGMAVTFDVAWTPKAHSVIFPRYESTTSPDQNLDYSMVDTRTRAVQPYLIASPPDGYMLDTDGVWNPARTALALSAMQTHGKNALLLYYPRQARAFIFATDEPVIDAGWSPDGSKIRLLTSKRIDLLDAP